MGEVSYAPVIDDMTWSYSRVKCFDDCPYKWFMKYIKNEEEEPMFYASFGSFMHSLLEKYYRGDVKKEDLQTEFLIGFQDNVLGTRPQESTVQKYINAGLEYFKTFEDLPYKPVAIEKFVRFEVGGEKFCGFIDYLGEKDGELYIVDHKSRDLKPRSHRKKPTLKDQELDDMLRQLYLYAAAVHQEYGKFPKALCFNCFKTGTLIEEPFNEDAYNEAIEWTINNIRRIKNTEEFWPNIDFYSCYYICGLRGECCYWEMR